MRYLKDGEEVAQVGDIPSSQAGRHGLSSHSLSFPTASPRGLPRPGQRFSFPLLHSQLGLAGRSAAVTCAELGTSMFKTQKVSNMPRLLLRIDSPHNLSQSLLSGSVLPGKSVSFGEYATQRKVVEFCLSDLKMVFRGTHFF